LASHADIERIVGILIAAYPVQVGKLPVDRIAAMIEAYHIVLHDLPADVLERAVEHCISSHTFCPAAAELRAAAFGLSEWARRIPTAQDAWAELTRAQGKGFWQEQEQGGYVPRLPTAEDWSHPLVQQALEGIGGWAAFRMSDNVAADRARFIQAYEVYLRRAQEEERMLPEVRQAVGQLADRLREEKRLGDGK